MPHIEAANVALIYDTPSGRVPAVEDVSFGIETSEFLCIVGPSGCGKSSLLNIIAGSRGARRWETSPSVSR
jgi:NitT/TauT family transport system ATP-binding protein